MRLELWDTGIGIAGEDRDKIFDDFVQLGNPERDRRKGMGLGLSIARRAVALLGGEIELRSRTGRGTMFAFAQPLADAPAAIARPLLAVADHAALPLAGLSALIVDDDPQIGAALARLLGQWGVAFDIFTGSGTALEAVAAGRRYDLVLVDYRLGEGMDGLELAGRIAALHAPPRPAISLLTGDLDPAIMARASAASIPLLHKPLNPARLRALFQSAASAA